MSWLFGPSEKTIQINKILEHLNDIAHLNGEAIRGLSDIKTIIYHALLTPKHLNNLDSKLKEFLGIFLYTLSEEDLKQINMRCGCHKNDVENKKKLHLELNKIKSCGKVHNTIKFYNQIDQKSPFQKPRKIVKYTPVRISDKFVEQISELYLKRNDSDVLKPLLDKHKRVDWDALVRDPNLIDYLEHFGKEEYEHLDLDYLFKKRCPEEPNLLEKITYLSETNPGVWKVCWNTIQKDYQL